MAGLRQTPLTCSGHTRPVVDLCFSKLSSTGAYYLISACKDGKPMLRQGDTGDWIGTFVGHKGAVWGVALNKDASRAATGAADFTAKVAVFALWILLPGPSCTSLMDCIIVANAELRTASLICAPLSAKDELQLAHQLWLHSLTLDVNDVDGNVGPFRFWDYVSGTEVGKLELPSAPSDLELTPDGSMLLVTHGHMVSTWSTEMLEKMKEFQIPSQVNSASLLPDKSVFVCGGEDFKMYKFEYETGTELV
ncbi:hypothetical protein HPB52_015045 [Rhipicephalus sanguineus]|uniref:Serine-threonine kinase receptor-associated protein n=1 Tax=Rhipicephalus sanguineus TaxID=34632 RepID=A0A9D4PFS5_RHISA|nr:hypothetical protein HPB52_015045 [Rhipicephalus sanguineus]